jgi:hypothetical protein
MNDNLPDINFKEKKEKKGGFIGWFRGKLGFGSRGGIGGAGVNPAAMNAGRAGLDLGKAFGAGKFGASSAGGLAGLLAGKASTIAAIAMVAIASGVYLANNSSSPGTGTAAFSSDRGSDNYVPAILRSQAANQGSSLDMFKDTNKGALSMEEAAKAAEAKDGAKDGAAEDPAAPDPNAQPGDNAGQDMMAKLQGGNMASLTSQLGGGSNKFSNMGGFSNKFNQGTTGAKTGFSSGIGSGFSAMPKFDSRKGKMLAMKGSARPVFGGAKAGKKGSVGAGAFGQAKGMREIQKSFTGDTADGARSTQDKAWEGTTGDEAVSAGGAGLGDGGAGIVTSPSIDNVGDTGGGAGGGTPNEPTVPDATPPIDVSPWAGLLQQAMMYIILSAVLSAIGGYLVKIGQQLMKTPYTATVGAMLYGLGIMLCVAAMALGVMALMMGVQVMSSFGQTLLGSVYILGGGVAIAAALMAMTGKSVGPITPMWMSAIAGVIGLMASMFAN